MTVKSLARTPTYTPACSCRVTLSPACPLTDAHAVRYSCRRIAFHIRFNGRLIFSHGPLCVFSANPVAASCRWPSGVQERCKCHCDGQPSRASLITSDAGCGHELAQEGAVGAAGSPRTFFGGKGLILCLQDVVNEMEHLLVFVFYSLS